MNWLRRLFHSSKWKGLLFALLVFANAAYLIANVTKSDHPSLCVAREQIEQHLQKLKSDYQLVNLQLNDPNGAKSYLLEERLLLIQAYLGNTEEYPLDLVDRLNYMGEKTKIKPNFLECLLVPLDREKLALFHSVILRKEIEFGHQWEQLKGVQESQNKVTKEILCNTIRARDRLEKSLLAHIESCEGPRIPANSGCSSVEILSLKNEILDLKQLEDRNKKIFLQTKNKLDFEYPKCF